MAYALLQSGKETNETGVCVFEREDHLGGKIIDFNFTQAPDVVVGKFKIFFDHYVFSKNFHFNFHPVKRCHSPYYRGVAKTFQRGAHTVSQPAYLHGPLPILVAENGVCNYLALEKICEMLILRIRAFSQPEL